MAKRILRKIDELRFGLRGNVKRLKRFIPNYRLRVGDLRVLFKVSERRVVIHDIRHRSQAYDLEKLVVKTKYDVLTRNGREQFVVVPLKDFEALMERVEDENDHRLIERSKKQNAGKRLISHERVMREFGLTPREPRRKR